MTHSSRQNQGIPSRNRVARMGHCFSATLLTIYLLAMIGCDTEQSQICTPECANDMRCEALPNSESGQCVPLQSYQIYQGNLPARSLSLAAGKKSILYAAIEPVNNRILAGEISSISINAANSSNSATQHNSPESHDIRILEELLPGTQTQLRMATNDQAMAVVWFDENNKYHIATRLLASTNDAWTVSLVAIHPESERSQYHGSEHFSVMLDANNRVHIVFHDQQAKSLYHLRPNYPGSQQDLNNAVEAKHWVIESIDDGQSDISVAACPTAQREQAGQGLGIEPSSTFYNNNLYVAYFDADCGDLRLARNTNGNWLIEIIDTGARSSASNTVGRNARGRTGRFPSLAILPNGHIGIAYYDMTRGQLLYARSDTNHYAIEVVDDGYYLDHLANQRKQFTGAFAQLLFLPDGQPTVAYMNTTTGTLHLATRMANNHSSDRWISRIIDANSPVGFFARQVYATSLGHIIAAEKLIPTPSGMRSTLSLHKGGAP